MSLAERTVAARNGILPPNNSRKREETEVGDQNRIGKHPLLFIHFSFQLPVSTVSTQVSARMAC